MVYYDGEDVNLQMVRAGLAWHYKEYGGEQSCSQRWQYSKAESRARSDRLGLWDGESIAPWVLRKIGKS